MAEDGARRYRVYVSKAGKLFIEGSFDSENDATSYANSIKGHYHVVSVRSVFRPAGSIEELEEDHLLLRGGQEVPLKGGSAEPPTRAAGASRPRRSNRLLVNSLTALLLLAITLFVVHTAVLPLWGVR